MIKKLKEVVLVMQLIALVIWQRVELIALGTFNTVTRFVFNIPRR